MDPPAPDDDVPCPLDELLKDLAREGHASPGWISRFSQGPGDPIAAAWEHAREPRAMLGVLHLADADESPALVHALTHEIASWPGGVFEPRANDRSVDRWSLIARRLIGAIRAAAPPPLLLDVLRASPRRMARIRGSRSRRSAPPPTDDLWGLLETLEEKGRPSTWWLVNAAMNGVDPIHSYWHHDVRATVRVLSIASPVRLARMLTELLEILLRSVEAHSCGQIIEHASDGRDVSLEVADRLERAAWALEDWIATDVKEQPEEMYKAFDRFLYSGSRWGIGSDSVWGYARYALENVQREELPRLHEVLEAWTRGPWREGCSIIS
jgi:hypothetical protein